jgi:diguanylate cyclase (GGDEF)-like protein
MASASREVRDASKTAVPPPAWHARTIGAGVGIALGLALLADYGDATLRARHAITGSPEASNPVAAACILLLGLAALATSESRLGWRLAAQSAIGLALLLILTRISDLVSLSGLIEHLPLPGQPAPSPATPPLPSAFEATLVLSLFLLAAAAGLLQCGLVRTGQILAAAAAAGFLLALLGYAARLPPFHHPAALFIGLAGAATALSVMTATIEFGFLRDLGGAQAHARLIRQGLGATSLGILLIGALVACFCKPRDGALMIGAVVLILAWVWATAIVIARRMNTLDGQRRAVEAHLLHDAATDSLTGLLSRNKLDALTAERQPASADAAVIVIDIDRFRSVNNALGTSAGDSLLVQAAKRLANLAEPHRVGRAGGDGFAIVCDGIGPAVANRLARAAVEIMAVPFRLADGRQFHVTASVGVAHGAVEGITALRHAAEEAMHIAKTQGGNQAVPFVSAMRDARIERIGLEQDLHRAFESSSELFLVYQPIISLRDRRVVAVEALARWQHPRGGIVPPACFVGIAESAGMYLGLGRKLRELAVVQAARWRDAGPGQLPVINLNVSPLELARSDVPGILGALIDHHGLDRSGFCLEVTEGSFADERALQSLQLARNAGFKIAMDDFGVGYSSLTQLPRLPLTSVKLDRGFLDQAMESEAGLSLLATMVQLAHVLKLPVVAEGVESRRELGIVSDCGCDSVQGFLFSHPLTAQQLEPWLKPDHKALSPLKAH